MSSLAFVSLYVMCLFSSCFAEAGESRGQQIETILVNMVKPRLY